jgi:hypothetical protein
MPRLATVVHILRHPTTGERQVLQPGDDITDPVLIALIGNPACWEPTTSAKRKPAGKAEA